MSNIARFDAIRSVAYASIGASYTTLGTPFTHAMRVVQFVNNTNGDMMVSFDGTTDNVVIPADTFGLYDITSDQDSVEKFRYQVGTQLFVRYLTAPTGPATGAFYAICIYGKGE